MTTVLTRNWWALALRGSVQSFWASRRSSSQCHAGRARRALWSLCDVDGVLAIIAGVRAAERHERWWSPVLKGSPGLSPGC